jgi:TfoX/Sxy family transcriptional regulator of competence genes
MAFDEVLAERVRGALSSVPDVAERRMFGGLAFMVSGHMACGILGDELMLRLGNEDAGRALDEPHTRPMDFTGRPMRSMLFVERAGVEADEALNAWVDRGVDFARSLPPKA